MDGPYRTNLVRFSIRHYADSSGGSQPLSVGPCSWVLGESFPDCRGEVGFPAPQPTGERGFPLPEGAHERREAGVFAPPPVRLRAEPLSHRLPLQGGVLEASTRLPVELYHSPLEGESQKPSRRRRLMGRGAIATPQSSADRRRLMRWEGDAGLPGCDAWPHRVPSVPP